MQSFIKTKHFTENQPINGTYSTKNKDLSL